MIRPCFSPVINFGHLLQAAVVMVTMGGGAITAYVGLRAELDAQRADFRSAIAGHEIRLAAAERAIDGRRLDDRAFQAEMRAALGKIMDQLSDLRAQKQDRRQ
jgi:hypothetical protein